MNIKLKGKVRFKNESHWYVVKALSKQYAHLVDPFGRYAPVLLLLKNE